MNDSGSIFIWVLILAGCILVCFVSALLVRRIFFRVEDFPKIGFTMAELRQLHNSGQMSAEEFEKAKVALLGAAKNDRPGRKT